MFAPSYILQRVKDWRPAELDKRSSAFLADAAKATFGWMAVDIRDGPEGFAEV